MSLLWQYLLGVFLLIRRNAYPVLHFDMSGGKHLEKEELLTQMCEDIDCLAETLKLTREETLEK